MLDEIGRKAWTVELEDGGTAYAVYMSDVRAIFETQPPQPADGEAVSHDSDCAVHNEPAMPAGDCDCSQSAAGKVLSGWNGDEMQWFDGEPKPGTLVYFHPQKLPGVEVTEEMVQIANSAYQAAKASRFTITESECMRAALEAALSGVQR